MNVSQHHGTPSHFSDLQENTLAKLSQIEGRKIQLVEMARPLVIKTKDAAQSRFNSFMFVSTKLSSQRKTVELRPSQPIEAGAKERAMLRGLNPSEVIPYIPIETDGKVHFVPIQNEISTTATFFIVIMRDNGRQALVLKKEHLEQFDHLKMSIEGHPSFDLLLVDDDTFEKMEEGLHKKAFETRKESPKTTGPSINKNQTNMRQRALQAKPRPSLNGGDFSKNPISKILEIKATIRTLEKGKIAEENNIKEDKKKTQQNKDIVSQEIKKGEIRKEALKSQILVSDVNEVKIDGFEEVNSEFDEETKEVEESKKIKEKINPGDPGVV
ncbi:MAG: hypothetical protein LW832_01160 [Parachlamydia sp.]|jgi:hypothetical protein|nr:hypothetical protein [Parachlamydia sp.]